MDWLAEGALRGADRRDGLCEVAGSEPYLLWRAIDEHGAELKIL
jgi:hypothetical protein